MTVFLGTVVAGAWHGGDAPMVQAYEMIGAMPPEWQEEYRRHDAAQRAAASRLLNAATDSLARMIAFSRYAGIRLTARAARPDTGGMNTLLRRFRRPIRRCHVTLYTRAGCHLCDDAKKPVVRAVAATPGASLRIVDIAGDADLEARYGLRIPVVTVTGRGHGAGRRGREDQRYSLAPRIRRADGGGLTRCHRPRRSAPDPPTAPARRSRVSGVRQRVRFSPGGA